MSELGHRSPYATSGRAAVGGVSGHGAQTSEVTSADAFATIRSDHLGLTLQSRQEMLAWRLPYGTTVYAGLFTEMPDRLGIGGTELDIARVPFSRWISHTVAANARRTNAQSLQWEVLTEEATIVGWGVWTAATEGTLRIFDFMRVDILGDPVELTVDVGDRPGIPAGRIGLIL